MKENIPLFTETSIAIYYDPEHPDDDNLNNIVMEFKDKTLFLAIKKIAN